MSINDLDPTQPVAGVYDVIIVGGGAAGLSGALVLGRARRRVAVVDSGQPRNAPASHMQGFLGADGLPPSELLAVLGHQVGDSRLAGGSPSSAVWRRSVL
jgi:glycine/D-amino acid oxidase-like deaminating enzyme